MSKDETTQITEVKLEDFISQSLIQIINGVKAAQAHAKEHNAEIISNRMNTINSSSGSTVYMDQNEYIYPQVFQSIEFDIAVTASSHGGIKGGMGIVIPVIGIGYNATKTNENSSISRIKFSIPIVLPMQNK